MRKTIALAAALVAITTVACARKADIDTAAPGTGVTVRQSNGVSVSGKVVEVTKNHIIVDDAAGAGRAIDRRDVTSIAVEIPVAPPASAAASEPARPANGASPAGGVGTVGTSPVTPPRLRRRARQRRSERSAR